MVFNQQWGCQVVQHMREGRTLLGGTAKPYPWMEYTMRSRTKMEIDNVERAMTSAVRSGDSHCMCTRYYCDYTTRDMCPLHLFAIGYLLGGAFGIFTAGLDPAITDIPSSYQADCQTSSERDGPEREFICQELCCGWRHV